MNTPSLFDFRGHNVRVTMSSGTPWFVAADVCSALGLAGFASQHTSKLSKDERLVISHAANTRHLFENTRAPKITLISESGLYKLVMRSDKPVAREFQDWVTRVVLPSELAQVC